MKVLLLSGGLDSTVVLFGALRELRRGACGRSTAEPFDLALTVDYGQPHRSEIEAATRLVSTYRDRRRSDMPHEVLSLDFPVAPDCGLLGGHDLSARASVVPGRNVLFVALAAMRGATEVVLGCNADDQADYPDCRPEVLGMAGLACGVSVSLPLLSMTKVEVVERAEVLGLDLGDTVSCYRGTNCGECAACALRRG